eukprot:GHVU01227000.1.p2 GENE.GHVU01227000.1~~GHVU01227000.1.p2  ORF type:complete len:116 (+),score=5.59 GHVU01227000.1:474-821(+)
MGGRSGKSLAEINDKFAHLFTVRLPVEFCCSFLIDATHLNCKYSKSSEESNNNSLTESIQFLLGRDIFVGIHALVLLTIGISAFRRYGFHVRYLNGDGYFGSWSAGKREGRGSMM